MFCTHLKKKKKTTHDTKYLRRRDLYPTCWYTCFVRNFKCMANAIFNKLQYETEGFLKFYKNQYTLITFTKLINP